MVNSSLSSEVPNIEFLLVSYPWAMSDACDLCYLHIFYGDCGGVCVIPQGLKQEESPGCLFGSSDEGEGDTFSLTAFSGTLVPLIFCPQ